MSELCKYKDMFGEPGKGVHQYRMFRIALVDVLATLIGGYIIGYVIRMFLPWWNIPMTIGVLFLLGIILHRAFCVRTTIDKLLFPNAK